MFGCTQFVRENLNKKQQQLISPHLIKSIITFIFFVHSFIHRKDFHPIPHISNKNTNQNQNKDKQK